MLTINLSVSVIRVITVTRLEPSYLLEPLALHALQVGCSVHPTQVFLTDLAMFFFEFIEFINPNYTICPDLINL